MLKHYINILLRKDNRHFSGLDLSSKNPKNIIINYLGLILCAKIEAIGYKGRNWFKKRIIS